MASTVLINQAKLIMQVLTRSESYAPNGASGRVKLLRWYNINQRLLSHQNQFYATYLRNK